METVSRPVDSRVKLSQRYFNPLTLAVYDLALFGFIDKYAWGCPTERVLRHYRDHLSANHLEVGVGSGYLLDHSTFPGKEPRLALMDLSESCLQKTSRRLTRYHPQCYRRNILQPIEIDAPGFDSIAVNYVMHCVPGHFELKGEAFGHLSQLLNEDGVLFGSTVLSVGVEKDMFTRLCMSSLNKAGVFCNEEDCATALHDVLRRYFNRVEMEIVGCVALFACRDRKTEAE
ncbi:methyltransferase domain-containing protein [Hahella sp. KA22]|uniref:class I SAM-dependent methyltransferase n=1 Tax=Hahella sp. KA22 TaxID=1628392 RepID=UPI000FDDEFC1|nr:class I SAM-dependent methyltransferase [Hahella sp. KA22]AZZ93866.1 class I SAM-dependent methyltransferase [Hahella sp. KA22]QAY57239.1 methyltransferase domain-containing protein [Hahella sp. KA22]